jgi:hypothetical protein
MTLSESSRSRLSRELISGAYTRPCSSAGGPMPMLASECVRVRVAFGEAAVFSTSTVSYPWSEESFT